MKQLIIVIILTSLTQNLVYAGGGWTPLKGEGFFMLSQRSISGTFHSNTQAIIGKSPFSQVMTTNFYGEYGITDRFCGIIYSPFLTFAKQDKGTDEFGNIFESDNAIGMGDIDLAIKYRLLKGNYNLSASAWFGINSGNYSAGKTKQLHLGDGEFNQILRFDLSHAFRSFWWTIYAGFNHRTKNTSNEILAGGELGWKKGKFIGILKIDNRSSLFDGSRIESYTPGIYSSNLEYFGITTQVLYKLKGNLGLSLDAGFAPYLRNIIAAPSFTIGVYYNLKRSD